VIIAMLLVARNTFYFFTTAAMAVAT
jgi:hypothetical protein